MRIAPIVLALATALAAQTPVIIDTDAGSDDLMAIAFLLSRKDVKVEAITVVDGLAHVPAAQAVTTVLLGPWALSTREM